MHWRRPDSSESGPESSTPTIPVTKDQRSSMSGHGLCSEHLLTAPADPRPERRATPGRTGTGSPAVDSHGSVAWRSECHDCPMGTKWAPRLLAALSCLMLSVAATNCGSSPGPQSSLRTAQAAAIRATRAAFLAQYLAIPHGAPRVVETYLQEPPTTYVMRYFVPATHYLAVTETRNGRTTLCLPEGTNSGCLVGAVVSPVTRGPLSPVYVVDQLRQAGGRIAPKDVATATIAGQPATCFTLTPPPAVGTPVDETTHRHPKVCLTSGGVLAELGNPERGGLALSRLDTDVSAADLKQMTAAPPLPARG